MPDPDPLPEQHPQVPPPGLDGNRPEAGGDDLPQILPPLPPEERKAANAADGSSTFDMADAEAKLFSKGLPEHAIEAAALRNELARAYLENMKADRDMRKQYAGRILAYLECYSGGVGLLLFVSMIAKNDGVAQDPAVLTTLVGSTAVAAIGLVGFIARGLFRAPPAPLSDPFARDEKTS